jgi:hypothetical protein
LEIIMHPLSETTHPTPLGSDLDDTGADLRAAKSLGQSLSSEQRRALELAAPFVVDKLLDAGVVEERERAELLLCEVKKYLLLSHHLRKPLPMSSALVDAAWHQFVLFTREYASFCQIYLGSFFHHVPEAPPSGEAPAEGGMTQAEFVALYEASFGPIPAVWYDSECLSEETRLGYRHRGDVLQANAEAHRAQLWRGTARPELVCAASQRAYAALEFMATHRRFLVRELPGLRGPEERLALCRPLVRYGILRITL